MQSNASRWWTALAVVAVTAWMVAGCAWSVGGQKKEAVLKPTTGQQLIDLKRAMEQGALTEQEFEAQKRRLLSE